MGTEAKKLCQNCCLLQQFTSTANSLHVRLTPRKFSENCRMLDLSNNQAIESLNPREAPHWQILEYCRHIGLQKKTPVSGYWVARIRNKSLGYYQKRLIPWQAGTGNYDEALEAARLWFSQPEIAKQAADPFPIGSKQDLNYCPWGKSSQSAMRCGTTWSGKGYPQARATSTRW